MPSVPFLSAQWLETQMLAQTHIAKQQIPPRQIPPRQVPNADWWHGDWLDIQGFLTRGLRVDLDLDATLPDDVLGEVVFRRGKQTCISIQSELSREAEKAGYEHKAKSPNSRERHPKALAAMGRFRLTLAHEASHVILHGPLFEREYGEEKEGAATIHRCYKRENKAFGEEDFQREASEFAAFYGALSRVLVRQSQERARMEWQANRGAAALLMPAHRFRESAHELGETARKNAPSFAPAQHREWVLLQLAARFGTSVQAATIRANSLALSL